MELWIRSQDKEDLIKVRKKICITDYGDEYVQQFFVDDFRIGEYATKERALEVLDEIQIELANYVGTMAQVVYEMPLE